MKTYPNTNNKDYPGQDFQKLKHEQNRQTWTD